MRIQNLGITDRGWTWSKFIKAFGRCRRPSTEVPLYRGTSIVVNRVLIKNSIQGSRHLAQEFSLTAFVATMAFCRNCIVHGLEVECAPPVTFCQACGQKLPPGECARYATTNGELDDTCRHCSAKLIEDAPVRKLKPTGSHPEVPPRKMAAAKAPIPDEAAEETNIASMMKLMMRDMKDMHGDMKNDMNQMKGLLTESIEEVRAAARAAKNVAVQTRKTVDSIEKEIEGLKATVLTKVEASRHIEAEVKRSL